MNHRTKTIFNVARWEFNRFFKLSDTLKAILWIAGFGIFGGFIGFWVTTDTVRTQEITVHQYGMITKDSLQAEGFRFTDASAAGLDSLVTLLDQGEISGILSIDSENEARLWLKSGRGWVVQLENALSELRRDIRIGQLNMDVSQLEDLDKGLNVETLLLDEASRSSTADKLVAAYAVFLVLMAVFMGFAHQFTGITGEKQHRITEQVVSAIEPQTWMDGKILGITGVGIVNVMVYAVIGLIAYAGFMMVFGNIGFMGAITLVNPGTMLIFFLIAMLGILMWNAFLAAVAATIDNPNSSERSGLMLLPTLPVMFAFFTLYNPDSISIRILSWFPLTSPAVLPARMVQTGVMWWEVALAIVLLVAVIWLFRRMAGKIFATGMLMYGKEPSLKEMWYWMSRT